MKPKPISKRLSAFLLCFALLVGMLPVTASAATVGGFTIEGGSNGDYSYSNGVLTILTDTELTISNTNSSTATSDRIVISSGVDANITLAGVNITAPVQTSAIDVPSGASLTLTPETNSTNTLAVSAAATSILANNAGIHVPEGASLTIQCATASGDNHQCNDACGHLTVTGGEPSGNGFSGAGIGGNGAGYPNGGEDSGTVRVNGGNITITGGTSAYPGPGIGGGSGSSSGSNGGGDCGEVYITGGIVSIYGGSSNASSMPTYGAAGIGGGNTGMGNSGGSGGIVVITGGTVAVTGGSGTSSGSNSGYGGAGIGGGSSAGSEGAGGNGGTVIILTEVNVKGGQGDSSGSGGTPGNAIGGGFGNSGSNNGDEGDGIRPSTGGNNTYEVYGNLELPDGITIPEGVTVTVPSDSSLTVPEGTELVVNGKLEVENGGSLTNSGTVSGDGTLTGDGTVTNNGNGSISVSDNDFAANVSLSITSAGSTVTSVSYNSTVTLTATVTSGDNQAVTSGSVDFYRGEVTDANKLNDSAISLVSDGTAALQNYQITGNGWTPNNTPYTITAVYTPASGSSLMSGSGTGTLSVSKTTPGATPVGPISSSNRSETSITLNTVSDGNTGTYGPIQYGYTMGSLTTPVYWQDSTEFTDLQPGTDYTFYIRYKGNDFYNPSSPGSNTLVVTTNPQITTESLSAGHVGVNYEAQLTASVANGKNVTWSIISGPLPAGLELNGNTISGNPSVAGMSSITVQASIAGDMNGELQVTSTAALYITINQGTSVITAATYNSEIETNTFTYGDTITVSGTIAASATTPGTSTNSITQNQVGLYLDETELATADVESDGSFSLTYDTSKKGITPSESAQTLTVKYGGSSDLNSGETTVSITLNKKPVTVSLGGTTTKVYDGKTTAPDGLTYTVNDTLQDDAVTASGTATYDSADVGTNKTITANGLSLGGTHAGYYTLSNTTATTTGSIIQSGSELTATATNSTLTYGDTLEITVTPSATGQSPANNALTPLDAGDTVELYNGENLLAGTSTKNASGTYTLTYNTTGKGLTIGENTLTVQFNGDNNMAASTTAVTVNLSQKSVSATLGGTMTKIYDGTTDAPGVTISLSSVEAGDAVNAAGTPVYNSANVTEAKTITASDISLTGDDAGWYSLSNTEATTSGTITAAQMTGTVTFDGNAVYDTPLTATYEGNATSVTYQWYRTERNGTTTAIPGATESTYTPTGLDVVDRVVLYVIVTAIDTNHTGTVQSQSLTVGRLPGSITIGCADVTYGQTPSPYVVSNTNPEAPMWYTYTGRGDTVYAASRTPPTEAGTYSVSAYVEFTVTHSEATSNTVEFSILPADSSVSAPPAAVQDLVYTGQPQALVTAGTADGGTMVYSLDGETYTAEIPTATDAGTYTVWYMVQGDSNHNNSTPASVEVTIDKATAALTLTASPESLRGRGTVTLTLTGVPEGESATVACDNGITVTAGSNGTWTATLPNETRTYTFTAALTENDNYEVTPVTCTVKVTYRSTYVPPAETGPNTPDSEGWDSIQDEIADAVDGDEIVVDMGGTTEVPAEIFEEVAGKDVDVTFELNNGVSWTVNGKDIPESADISDLNLGVTLGTTGISVDVINSITGEVGTVQITLEHDGEFGFALTLTAPLGRENAGYWANLYHYDEDNERLTFETSARIADDGTAALRMTHASQYAIVIDDVSHEMPFEDVSEDDWFHDAVAYAYANGLMDGVGEGRFAPNATTTRAMVVTILYRLAGEPEVTGGLPFLDVETGAWYTEAVAWAAASGIVNGMDEDTFAPNGEITRQQLAAILYRYAAGQGYDVSASADLSGYPDAGQIQAYAQAAMAWAGGTELLRGFEDGTLQPAGNSTRAQIATVLMRFCQSVAG